MSNNFNVFFLLQHSTIHLLHSCSPNDSQWDLHLASLSLICMISLYFSVNRCCFLHDTCFSTVGRCLIFIGGDGIFAGVFSFTSHLLCCNGECEGIMIFMTMGLLYNSYVDNFFLILTVPDKSRSRKNIILFQIIIIIWIFHMYFVSYVHYKYLVP